MRATELIVDSFAGGGGASTGIERALGRSPDIAINHDAMALAMHRANHPETLHVESNIWKADPDDLVGNRPVGLLWASPDCKHFSKAKGGKPVKRNIRDLAWVVVLWAERTRPRVIILENVEEFQGWGPLITRDDGRQMPCPDRRGQEFKRWVKALKKLGYKVEWREMRACDYGAPTIRKRLFLIARRDGKPISWPKPTHGKPDDPDVVAGNKLPWRTAAEIIDWSIPCPSIFLTKAEGVAIGCHRPLVDNTMARIAKGVKRYVIDADKPFIVNLTHQGGDRTEDIDEPLRTVTGANRGEKALVAPVLAGCGGRAAQSPPKPLTAPMNTITAKADQILAAPYLVPRYGERPGQEPRTRPVDEPAATVVPTGNGDTLAAVHLQRQFGKSVGSAADDPAGTITAGGGGKTALLSAHVTKFRNGAIGSGLKEPVPTITANSFIKRPGGAVPLGVAAAFLAQHNTGVVGHAAREPVSTIVQKGCTQAVVSAGLANLKGSDRRMSGPDEPTRTQTATGWHQAEVRAFLLKYHGNETDGHDVQAPIGTVTTRERFSLVMIEGEPYEIVDIGMRMLSARELFNAQGFPRDYIIDHGILADGSRVRMTKTAAISKCGNSVCPDLAEALVAANCPDLAVAREAAE